MTTTPFPDAEKVLVDLLTQWGPTITPHPLIVATHVPDAERVAKQIEQGAVYVRARRVGGNAITRVTDGPVMEVSVIAATRAESWEVLRTIHARLTGWYGDVQHADGTVSTVTGITETKAPTQYPDLNPDVRRVQANFLVRTRRPRN